MTERERATESDRATEIERGRERGTERQSTRACNSLFVRAFTRGMLVSDLTLLNKRFKNCMCLEE